MSPIQSLEVIGFATESTYGTFVPPAIFVPGTGQVNTNTKLVRPDQSRGTRAQVVDAIVGLETGAQISAEYIPEVLSSLIACWFGTGSDAKSNAGAAFTHALTPKNALPSLSTEIDHDVVSQVLARQVAGCLVDQITLRATNQALATMETQLIGQRELTPATAGTPSNPTPTISTLQPMDFSLLAATYKGAATAQLMDVTLTLMNHVQRVFATNQKLYVVRLVPTKREVGLQTTLDFLDTTFYNDWFAGNKTAGPGLVLTLTSPTVIPTTAVPYSSAFTIPGIRPNGAYGLQSASDVLNQQLSWSVTQQGANEISASLVNSEAATLA